MGDKLGLNYADVRELKLGASFSNNKTSQYHTIKYDFKPASVDVNKMATVDVGTNNQVTVTVPHLDGAGVPQTVFKGSQRPYTKECVLIIDRVSGEITLEKLSSNIQVKKTRQECDKKARPLTPVTADFTNTTQRSTSRTRVATSKRSATHAGGAGAGAGSAGGGAQGRYNAPSQKTPPAMLRSPLRIRTSPPQAAPWSGGNSTLASLPMIGLDEPAPAHNGYARAHHERPPPAAPPLPAAAPPPPAPVHHQPQQQQQLPPAVTNAAGGGEAAAESSSSSSSESGSDSDSDSDDDRPSAGAGARPAHAPSNGGAPPPRLATDVLNDDLCLSESGSDSD